MFALDNAYFQLGHHILKQILGLPMGDPVSPPLAILYVAYDEHHATIPRSPSFLLVMLRYMDDVLALAGIYPPHPPSIQDLQTFITKELYEHDLPSKAFLLKQTTEHTFLDVNIVISPDRSFVKTTYFNKNASIISSNNQTIGRFSCPSSYQPKLFAFSTVLIKAFDNTTYPYDLLPPIFQIFHEAYLLHYDNCHLMSILLKTNRARPHRIWKRVHNLLSSL
jgi:hypothetical protein